MVPLLYSFVSLLLTLTSSDFLHNNSKFTNYNAYTWSSDIIYCDDNVDCVINCYGSYACESVTIMGPIYADLHVNCNSDYSNHNGRGHACTSMTIHASDSNNLFINVYNEEYEFSHSVTYTPRNGQTYIKCGIMGKNNINGQIKPYCGQRHHFWSRKGFENVRLMIPNNIDLANWEWSLASNYNWESIMYCGDNWQYNCKGWTIYSTQSTSIHTPTIYHEYYKCKDQSSECDYLHILSNYTLYDENELTTEQPKPIVTDHEFIDHFKSDFHDEVLQCIDNIDCTVNCRIDWGCYQSTIIGPRNADLHINCASRGSCEFMQIYAKYSNNLYINVSDNSYSFYRSIIYAPINDECINTFITCDTKMVCDEKIIDIYSQNGFRCVEWIYLSNVSSKTYYYHPEWADLNIMYCGNTYQYECVIDGQSPNSGINFECKDKTSVCYFNHSHGTRNQIFISNTTAITHETMMTTLLPQTSTGVTLDNKTSTLIIYPNEATETSDIVIWSGLLGGIAAVILIILLTVVVLYCYRKKYKQPGENFNLQLVNVYDTNDYMEEGVTTARTSNSLIETEIEGEIVR